jgi:hypothetical protein
MYGTLTKIWGHNTSSSGGLGSFFVLIYLVKNTSRLVCHAYCKINFGIYISEALGSITISTQKYAFLP